MPVTIARPASACGMILMLAWATVTDAFAAGAEGEWTVVKSAGSVTVTAGEPARERMDIHEGMLLHAPFTVRTGTDGHLVITHGADTLTVRPDSLFDIPVPDAGEKGLVTRINQALGSVLYKVERRLKDTFEVRTPYLVSVVKGTTFNILVTGDSSAVVLLEGRLLVHTPDKTSEVILEPGQAAVRSTRDGEIEVQDQQTLSPARTGPITIARNDKPVSTASAAGGPAPGDLPVGLDATIDRDAIPDTDLTSASLGDASIGDTSVSLGDTSIGDTSVSLGDASIGDTSITTGDTTLDLGTVDSTSLDTSLTDPTSDAGLLSEIESAVTDTTTTTTSTVETVSSPLLGP